MKGPDPAKVELRCPACARDSWLLRKSRYDGFTKTGEALTCALCGHVFASEAEIAFTGSRKPKVFSEDDRPRPVKVFREDEKGKMCRYCAEYVVNPFLQRCGLHRCEVQATDTCPHFRPKPPPPPGEEKTEPNPLRP
ncbi:MAG: hypothetical protein EOM72_00660 [Opitutae bacterium]|nr:hypothetical protein [Opitutae bacterium]